MFTSSMCLPSPGLNPPRQTTENIVAVSALRLCSKHMDTKNQTSIPDSTDARAEPDAAGSQRAGPVMLWKKTCSDKVYTSMYRFGICAFKYHRAEHTELEKLQTRLGNVSVEQAKAKSGLSAFSQEPWRSVEGHCNPWRASGMNGMKTWESKSINRSPWDALKMCFCIGMCVTGLPKHVICVRPRQNGSEHVEIVKHCRDLRDNVFTFVNGSGSKQALMY